jgi:hypothetical protein
MLQDALPCVNGWLGSGRDGARPSELPLLTKPTPELTISGCWWRFPFWNALPHRVPSLA